MASVARNAYDDSDCTGGDLCIDLECVEPECSTEFDCDDFLSQNCQGQFCVEQSCAEQNFLFYADAGAFSSVHVAGSFNATADGSWPGTIAAGGLALTYLESLGAWYGTLDIADGSYQYKFVLDETEWISDPLNNQSSPDGFGGSNSVLNISCGGSTGIRVMATPLAVRYPRAVTRRYFSGKTRSCTLSWSTASMTATTTSTWLTV